MSDGIEEAEAPTPEAPKQKLFLMPGVRVSPKLLLHQMLEGVDDMEGFAICIVYKDGGLKSGWANLNSGELAAAAMCLHSVAADKLRGD